MSDYVADVCRKKEENILTSTICFSSYLCVFTGIPISGPTLMAKAALLHPRLYPGATEKFVAGTGWLKRFRDRHGVRSLVCQGETLSANAAAIYPFRERFLGMVGELNLSRDQVFNCDETGLNWRALPRRTLVTGREKSASVTKKSKDRVTRMACRNASGTTSLLLMFIHKSAKPHCFKNVDMESLPVHYYSQKNAWMDTALFTKWFHDRFVPNVSSELQKLGLPCEAILLLDNAPSHPDASNISSSDGKITCSYLPPNTTSLIQPMDQGVLENIKSLYRREFLLKVVSEEENEPTTVIDYMKGLTIKDAVLMSARCWDEVRSKDTIKRSWRKLWPLLGENAADDPAESESSAADDIEPLLDQMNVAAEDRDAWLCSDANDLGYQVMDDDSIVSMVESARAAAQEQSSEEEDDVQVCVVSHSEACRAFKTVLEYLSQQDDVPMSGVAQVHALHIQAAKKRTSSLVQRRISDFFTLP